MFAPGSGEEFRLALVNAALLALWPVLPGLIVGYARQWLAARHSRPEFSLRKSETAEFNRARQLYARVCWRLETIHACRSPPNGVWHAVFERLAKVDDKFADEIEDLEAHAQHLRETIVRLKRRPLRRLRSWVYLVSSKYALGRAVAAYATSFAALLVMLHVSERQAWPDELAAGMRGLLAWYPVDARFFYANAGAAGVAAVTAPLFYFLRWARLRRTYGLEFCTFREFAETDPGQVIERVEIDPADLGASQQADAGEVCREGSWIAILGLSSSATIEDVKEAYKRLIKENHPDRVHGMSPAFRKLAEAETKKLNAAFRQALISVPRLGPADRWAPRDHCVQTGAYAA